MKVLPFNLLAACFVLLIAHGCAKTTHDHTINPAYRPSSENATEFVKVLKTSVVAVYPSIIRTPEGTSYSNNSQQQVVSLLNEKQVTTALAKFDIFDLTQLDGRSQWEFFQNDLHTISESLKSRDSEADYSFIMEILLPPGNQAVFGIHCYIFDRQGNNTFSFLLNSHHKLFVDADLRAIDSSESSRSKLIEKATRVGISALIQQVNAPRQNEARNQQGYSITSQKIATFDESVASIFIITRLRKPLVPVFMHSFKHSLISGFETNGIEAILKYMPGDSSDYSKFKSDIESFSPDAVMHIDLDPLYRKRKDRRQVVVGTKFEVSVIKKASEEVAWQATGKVDYIQDRYLNRGNYTAHEGIRKEFAWHTTAAIVRSFMLDVNGRKSAPIYTVTEDRALYRQRTD